MTLLRNLEQRMYPPRPAPRSTAIPPRRVVNRAMPEITAPAAIEAPVIPRRIRQPVHSDDRHLEAPWGPDYLKKMLRRQDAIPQGSRVGTQNVHVSSLSDFCARSYVLADEEQKLLDRNPTGGHKVMWALGRAIEKHVRDSLIADRGYHGVIGVWRCLCKEQQYKGLFPFDAPACARCGTFPKIYKELTLIDQDACISGNPDLVLVVNGALLPIEIKSMNKKDWDLLQAPVPDHVFQVLSYDKLFGITTDYEMMGVSALVYVSKDFVWGDPYKEYHIETVDPTMRNVIDLTWEDGYSLAGHRQNGTLPPRLKCASITCSRAKACPVATTCWLRSSA